MIVNKLSKSDVMGGGVESRHAWNGRAVREGATYPLDEVASNIAVQVITPEQE